MSENQIEMYYGRLQETLREAFAQHEALEKAARAIKDAWRAGKMVYAFGTGHAHMLSLEGFYRAGGPARMYPILKEELMLHRSASESSAYERKEGYAASLLAEYPVQQGDCLIVFSNSGRNAVPVEMAVEAKKRGLTVIAMTSLKHSRACAPRNKLNLRLFEAADIVLDNCGCPGDAAVQTADGRMIGATSTVVCAALWQAILCRADALLLEEGVQPETFASANVDGGDQINQRLIEKYKGVIKCL